MQIAARLREMVGEATAARYRSKSSISLSGARISHIAPSEAIRLSMSYVPEEGDTQTGSESGAIHIIPAMSRRVRSVNSVRAALGLRS